MRKIAAIVPIILTVLVIISFQVVFLTRHQFIPYPDPFGRERDASISKIKHPVETPTSDTFAYPSIDHLSYGKLQSDGSVQMEQRPLPDSEWKDLFDYKLVGDYSFWIGNDKQLYSSRWDGQTWTSKRKVSVEPTLSFTVTKVPGRDDTLLVSMSNSRTIEVGTLQANHYRMLYSLPITKSTNVRTVISQASEIYIAAMDDHAPGSTILWFAEGNLSGREKPMIHPIKKITLQSSYQISTIQLGVDESHVYYFYEQSSYKKNRAEVILLTFPIGQPETVTEQAVTIPTQHGDVQTTSQPYVDSTAKALTLSVSALYSKDARYQYAQPYLIHYKDGKEVTVQRASGARGATLQPVTFTDRWNHQWAVWLDALDYDRYQVLYTNDNPLFRSKQNVLTWSDYSWALQTTPLFLGFSLFLLLYAFKWAPVSYLYLIVVRFRNENHFFDRSELHVRVASSIYLLAKLLFVSDLYKPYAISFMPAWMLPMAMHYVLMIVIFAFAWGWTMVWRRFLPERNPMIEFTYLFFIDAVTTALWFSYFLSPTSFT